jgi:hypothetical protein
MARPFWFQFWLNCLNHARIAGNISYIWTSKLRITSREQKKLVAKNRSKGRTFLFLIWSIVSTRRNSKFPNNSATFPVCPCQKHCGSFLFHFPILLFAWADHFWLMQLTRVTSYTEQKYFSFDFSVVVITCRYSRTDSRRFPGSGQHLFVFVFSQKISGQGNTWLKKENQKKKKKKKNIY